jgi:hypothetical protein
MSAVEAISEIKKLPATQPRQVFRFGDEDRHRTEDGADHAAADRAPAHDRI